MKEKKRNLNDINYVVGDATEPQGDGVKIIAHVCNDIGAWGAGFVLALSRKWSYPEESYRSMSDEDRTLGNVRLLAVEDDILVANMIGQEGTGPDEDGVAPVRYYAIGRALKTLNQMASIIDASIHMPRIGAGLAGGNWETIEMIIRETTTVPVTVYDLK